MIPSDIASKLLVQTELPAATQGTQPTQKVLDALSDFQPGQRLFAEIQALLPNGTYRAAIAQRDITLALPFSAKPGDSLELEVVESDGKMTLAFVANRTTNAQSGNATESVATTLTRTGQLIGDLLSGLDEQGKKPAPAPLNGNQPLTGTPPSNAAELAPVLKEALSQSGVFYESHQARWAEGKLPTEALLQEPQGKLSPSQSGASMQPGNTAQPAPGDKEGTLPATARNALQGDIGATTGRSPIHPELTPLVQQQLDALATQTYVWQGQVWPGQNMHWEISEEAGKRNTGDDDQELERWKTSLRLDLPSLGGIEATIQLKAGKQVEITISTTNMDSEQRLRDEAESLRTQLETSAGLGLRSISIQYGEDTD